MERVVGFIFVLVLLGLITGYFVKSHLFKKDLQLICEWSQKVNAAGNIDTMDKAKIQESVLELRRDLSNAKSVELFKSILEARERNHSDLLEQAAKEQNIDFSCPAF